MEKKIEALARLIESQTIETLKKADLGCEANIVDAKTKIKSGNKYTKINVGSSGKYMIDRNGNIFGIKGYNVVHSGHRYGTLDTISDYYWGEFTAYKI